MSIQRFKVTPTVTASSAYTANDVVGGRLQFTGARKGTIQSVSVTDKAAQNVGYLLIFFESQPTDITDHTTYAIADADLDKIVWRLSLSTSTRQAFSTNSYHYQYNQNVPVLSSGGSLWAFLITTGTPTYDSTSDITVTIQMETETPWAN